MKTEVALQMERFKNAEKDSTCNLTFISGRKVGCMPMARSERSERLGW
jgi:hypothetical protein